jgi:uncharacterized protein (TIGR00288 family)
MNVPYIRAPHQGGMGTGVDSSPHAALLIDFDNVTVGMRSDLSKELKNLLDSDVTKGKVSVQRAYADWRRYPQYVVPLSEASVDLIFAPAYGSSKKNATDIRMAIDALELIFIRPEIGTYILLTGDSDFSSLVLKLKEYGKYVIGVGIEESSSDILVQNCDEYYSYTSLTGLTKTTDLSRSASDPWVLVKDAVDKMVKRRDVMRSDRLKQVMQELDPTFDEGSIGFSKFSKFLSEATSRGLIELTKLENGQYEVGAGKGGRGSGRPRSDDSRSRRGGRGGRGRDRSSRSDQSSPESSVAPSSLAVSESTGDQDVPEPLREGYDVLVQAITAMKKAGREPVRDSDVKRKILERKRNFDEGALGFQKFSLFLTQAAQHGVVRIERTKTGNLDVFLPDATERAPDRVGVTATVASTDAPIAQEVAASGPTVTEVSPPAPGQGGLRLGPRRGSTRRRGEDEGPTLFEGQSFGPRTSPAPSQPIRQTAPSPESVSPERVEPTSNVTDSSSDASSEPVADSAAASASASASPTLGSAPPVSDTAGGSDVDGLGLPSDPGAIVRYLTHRYKGVGEKTAETLVEQLGSNLFRTMQENPDEIARIVPRGRAEQVLDAWRSDYERRKAL